MLQCCAILEDSWGLPRTIPIASATSLSEYGAVDIDMDLVFAELLHSEVFCFGSEVEVTP